MYREAPPMCTVCGRVIHLTQTDVLESGIRCRRCSDAAAVEALKPTLAEIRETQREWANRRELEADIQSGRAQRGCRRHPRSDLRCWRCVLRALVNGEGEGD